MMGERQTGQGALFYEFSLERHVPAEHMLRAIDRFVDLSELRAHLASFYSPIGRPSVDPELLIRMLIRGLLLGHPPGQLPDRAATHGTHRPTLVLRCP